MDAHVGDSIVTIGSRVDHSLREGEILEVRGLNGAPPYLVQWSDTGQMALVYPGPDAVIRPTRNSDG
jgi:Domain of unknown function (DUF1918)